jgi:hypothetical protein
MPDRVVLIHLAHVRSAASGLRRELRIGHGALSFLTRGQLEALVAHELAPLRYRNSWLVLRLREIYQEEKDAPETRLVRRERILARLADFWSTVEDDADAAAMSFGGARNAAEAVVTVALGGGEHVIYALDQHAPNRHSGIQDLDDGWRRYLTHGDGSTVDDDWKDQASEHTTLAAAIQQVGEVRLRMADGRVEVAPLSERHQRVLAQRSQLLLGVLIQWRLRRIRWYTFATAPARWWVVRAEYEVDRIRRHLEISAQADLPDALDDTDEGTCGLRLYAELQLLQGGWRLEHPAVRGVLLSPTGDRVDLTTMEREALISLVSQDRSTVD